MLVRQYRRDKVNGVLQRALLAKGRARNCLLFACFPFLIPLAALSAQAPELDLVRESGFHPTNLGYVVVDFETGEMQRAYQAKQVFIPASMLKILTAFAALETLGADFRFETPVYGENLAGGLRLHLSGGGDPVLVEEDLRGLADSLRRRIGSEPVAFFTYDHAAVPFIPAIDPSDDIANSYNPPVTALSVNFNRQWLQWQRSPDHYAMLVRVLPDLGHAISGVAPVRPGDGRPVQVFTGGLTRFLIEPQVPSEGQRRVAVHRPALRAALMLRQFAADAGLAMPEPRQAVRPGQASVLAVNESRPLLEIADGLLRYSNNLSAELVGLTVATQLARAPQSLEESADVVRSWAARSVPAFGHAGMRWPNQSGLSGEARLSPEALMDLLLEVRNRTYGDRPFLELLSEPRWSEGDSGLTVRAKSGTMSYARGQAGLLTTPDGRPFLFVLMHTDFDARARFERNPLRFGNPVRRQAGRWLDRARRLERAILRHWAETL